MRSVSDHMSSSSFSRNNFHRNKIMIPYTNAKNENSATLHTYDTNGVGAHGLELIFKKYFQSVCHMYFW